MTATPELGRTARRRLLGRLVADAPWLDDPDLGPRAVDAGSCDRCDVGPRVVATCGPTRFRTLCRDCLVRLGRDAFCAGHAAEADELVARAHRLPSTWATLVRLTWVARGEVRADADFLAHAADVLGTEPLPTPLRRPRDQVG